MRIAQAFLCGLAAVTINAQGQPVNRPLLPGDPADAQTFSRTVQALRRAAQLHAAAGTEADKLLEEAAALLRVNQSGEARRKLARAQAIIGGKSWVPKQEFAWSVALRPQRLVVEQSRPMVIDLAQYYAAAYQPAAAMRLRVSLHTVGRESREFKQIGTFDAPSRDLVAEPFRFEARLSGVPDGSYRLTAELMEGDSVLAGMQHSIGIAEGIESRISDIESRLSRIQGHDSAKATVRWPFDMARIVNMGIRKLETADFGLPETGTTTFDFSKELKDSAEVLKALESGKDPLVRAKGDRERHYWFEEALEIMPYRVYVPSAWDGKKQLPLMFVLHGNTRDHNFYFDRDGGILAKLAEKHGYIVATTMGYRPNAGYNSNAIGSLSAVAADGRAGRGGFASGAAQRRQAELSEKDAMNTLDLVIKEFNPDPSRIYLFGHSAGGAGGWYLASKYPERFTAVALSAFGTQPQSVPFDRLKGLPVLVIIGSKDSPRTVETARSMAAVVKSKGFDTRFLEIPEATHDTIVGLALPTVYEFFTKHRRR